MSVSPSATEAPRGRGLLRRHLAVLIVTTVLVTAGAWTYGKLQQPTYTAQASVLVEPLTLPTAVQHTPDMGTEQAVVTSSAVLQRAAATLGRSLSAVHDAVAVTVPVDADLLDIQYSSSDPTAARDGATAVATSYMRYRASTNARTTARDVATRLSAPGVQTRLVTPAALPTGPSAPDVLVDVLAGVVVGMVAAVGLAFALDRFGSRMRSPKRWQEITDVPVLVALKRGTVIDDQPADGGRAGTALRYLRLRVAQALPARGGVLLVTEVREHDERAAVARFLAEALADTGHETVLVELDGDVRVRVTVSRGPGTTLPGAGEWHTGTVAELLHVVERHRGDRSTVVVSAPPPALAVATLEVAAIADTALVVDHVSTARRREALRVIAELRAAGCRIAGCVLLGRARTRIGEAGPDRAADIPPGGPAQRRHHPRSPAPRVTLTHLNGSTRPIAVGPDFRDSSTRSST